MAGHRQPRVQRGEDGFARGGHFLLYRGLVSIRHRRVFVGTAIPWISKGPKLFYLDLYSANPRPGFHHLSTSREWIPWLREAIPADIHLDVRRRLKSNLKHIMVGLEMKAGLIVPHGERVSGRSVLFEPYFQIMNFEFSVGVFSACEGLGSVHHLAGIGDNAATGARVNTNDWIAALCHEFDPTGAAQLDANVRRVKEVRDKMHQDRLGARADIDWHDFNYNESFIPSRDALRTLLRRYPDDIPEQTNLC